MAIDAKKRAKLHAALDKMINVQHELHVAKFATNRDVDMLAALARRCKGASEVYADLLADIIS